MYVCLCNGYTDNQIKTVVHEGGVTTAEEAYLALGNGFCCGACQECANDLVSSELPKRSLMAAE